MAVVALSGAGRQMRIVLIAAVAVAMLAVPSPSHATHESVQGRVLSFGQVGGGCFASQWCRAFLATNCPADDALYKDDHHPFISVKSVASFTAKDRTAMLRLTAAQPPDGSSGLLAFVGIKNCDVNSPPPFAQHHYVDLKVGQSVRVGVPKGTRWVAVWEQGLDVQVQWKLTFNHLS